MSQINYPGNQEDFMPANQQGLIDYDMPELGHLFYCYTIDDSTKFSMSKTSTLLLLDDTLITPSNMDLIKRHVIYLPKEDREKLRPENRVWADFLEAHDCFMGENDYPIDTPDDEKQGKERNLKEAVQRFHLLADGPDNFGPAQYFLALAYENEWNGKIDPKKSTDYYKQAAANGIADAQYTLGKYYKYGIGVEENQELAHRYTKQAAKQGMPQAQFDLAQTYQYGSKKRPEKYFYYYELAVLGKHARAQYELGNCYFNGHGTEKSYDRAKECFTLALQNGYKPAEQALERFKTLQNHEDYKWALPQSNSHSYNQAHESEQSVSSAEKKDLHCLSKSEMSEMIFTMRGQIDYLRTEMTEMKKRLAALENPKPKHTHGGKESPSKRLKLRLKE